MAKLLRAKARQRARTSSGKNPIKFVQAKASQSPDQ